MKFETMVLVDKKVTAGNILARLVCAVLVVLSIVTALVTMMIPWVLPGGSIRSCFLVPDTGR